MRTYSLAFLTVNELDPISAIYTASQAGYDAIGVRLLKANPIESDYPLLDDDALLSKVLEAKQETGIAISDAELVRLKPDTDVATLKPFFKRAKLLGVAHVIVAGDDDDLSRISAKFKALCALASEYGITANLEPMTWTSVYNIKIALRIIESANMPNGGILIDPLHFHRSGDTVKALKSIPKEIIHLFQICDAPLTFENTKEALIHTARANRLLPGDGEINLKEIIDYIPESAVVSLEVPNVKLAKTMTDLERTKLGLAKTKSICER
jgi:sugar phosphate isomerase/epimerase